MQFTQIKEVCFYSKNLELIKAFYHQKLGLEIISDVANKLVFFRAGSSVLLCFNPEHSANQDVPPPHYAQGKPHFAFEVPREDYEKTKQELNGLGISIDYEHVWPSKMKSAYFSDPEGNVLEIVPSGLWEAL